MKVAIVYDRVNKWGGAEQLLLALREIWPEAPLYTSVYNEKTADWAKVFPKVVCSFLQKWPWAKNHHELYPWLTPLAFESFNFDEFDVVISVTSAEAKSVLTKPKTLHVCYCLTPTRYLWSGYFDYLKEPGLGILNGIAKYFLPAILYKLRLFDQVACQRPDVYLAISKTVQERIKKYYQKESQVVFPPVNTEAFIIKSQKEKPGDYFLIVSRLVPYKNIDLAIEVFNELGGQLKIVGVGKDETRLKFLAKTNIQFLGELTEQELLSYYQDCRAVLVCGEEDFGLVSLEAQACGKPVLAFAKGGVEETVIETKTGLFFSNPESLKEILNTFEARKFSAQVCRNNALRYNKESFKNNFVQTIDKLWRKHQIKTTTL